MSDVNTFIDHDNGTGHITSPAFTITRTVETPTLPS